jgi:hypothetical protein
MAMHGNLGPFAAMLTLHRVRIGKFQKSFRCAARLGSRVSFCVVLVLWLFHQPLLIPPAMGESSMPNPSASEETRLKDAFAAAMRKLEAERKTNRAYDLPCTQFFSEFHRYGQIEPYIAFFQEIGVPANMSESNRKHFVSFKLTSEQLSSQGYNFPQGDRLEIVFTTASASSSEITSFKAILFARDVP